MIKIFIIFLVFVFVVLGIFFIKFNKSDPTIEKIDSYNSQVIEKQKAEISKKTPFAVYGLSSRTGGTGKFIKINPVTLERTDFAIGTPLVEIPGLGYLPDSFINPSIDGQNFAFFSDYRKLDLIKSNNIQQRVRLLNTEIYDQLTGVVWSSDGLKIGYSLYKEGKTFFYIANTDGTNPIIVGSSNYHSILISLNYSLNKIFWDEWHRNLSFVKHQYKIADIVEDKITNVREEPRLMYIPYFAADGVSFYKADGNAISKFTYTSQGYQKQTIIVRSQPIEFMAISPYDNYIVFLEGDNKTNKKRYLLDLKNNRLTEIDDNPGYDRLSDIRWSQNEKYIWFDAPPEPQSPPGSKDWNYYIYDIEKQELKKVFTSTDNQSATFEGWITE